jgi:UDP-glucuronate 4-epimerase
MGFLVTGSAGFIGFHVAAHLLDRSEQVIGVDNLNPYYDVALKRARLAELEARPGFEFRQIDVSDLAAMTALAESHPEIDRIIHLAAQAGVRYSLIDPLAYIDANVKGQVVLFEVARKLKGLKALVYASSSSVYGSNKKQPFGIEDRVDHPVSLYAASKRAGELIAESYSRVYGLSAVGLRFFTVYGPWGRPDMAAYLFTDAILADRPVKVFNQGRMERDFTYIDDVVSAVAAAAVLRLPTGEHRLYNIGNNHPEKLLDFIAVLEDTLGRRAKKEMLPMQPGDVPSTYADIEAARRDLGYDPKTPIAEGLPRFVAWYRKYHGFS